MYLMTDTLKRWKWMLFLWHMSRGWWYKACLSVYLHGLWVWEMIYTSTYACKIQEAFSNIHVLPPPTFLFSTSKANDEQNVKFSGVLFLSFSLAWGRKYIENLLVTLFILSQNMSNNCKAGCWNNLGRSCTVITLGSEVSYCRVPGILLVTPGDNFPFVLPLITNGKGRVFFVVVCFLKAEFWSFFLNLVSTWVITSSCMSIKLIRFVLP